MNIYLHELKENTRITLIWSFSLAFVAIFFMALFPSFSHNAGDLTKLLEGYPEAVRKMVGISLETIGTLPGFYSYIFSYIVFAGSIFAMILGISVISKEVREKTADFLMTKPVSRSQIFRAKLMAALTAIVITNAVYLIVANAMATIVSPGFDLKIFNLISLTLFFVQLMFFSLGVVFSVILPKIKAVVGISLATVFSFFIIAGLGSVLGEEKVNYITPFKYFDPAKITKNGAYDSKFMIIEILFIVLATFISYLVYAKRDIDSA